MVIKQNNNLVAIVVVAIVVAVIASIVTANITGNAFWAQKGSPGVPSVPTYTKDEVDNLIKDFTTKQETLGMLSKCIIQSGNSGNCENICTSINNRVAIRVMSTTFYYPKKTENIMNLLQQDLFPMTKDITQIKNEMIATINQLTSGSGKVEYTGVDCLCCSKLN